MAFRFIHTADWQVGKPFGNIPGDAGSELRLARIDVVRRIAELARERNVDAVLVAGDAFDSNEVQDRTILRLLDALKPFSGPWIFLPGNHDAALAHSVWTRMRRMGVGDNVVVADRPEPIEIAGRAVVLPAPLRRRRESDDPTSWFDGAATADGVIRVGLAHGSVADRLPAAAEASNEIPPDRAATARLDYLALGDWHGALRIAERTFYSGTPETDRHRANLSGFVHLVAIDGAEMAPEVETIRTGRFDWHDLDVEILDGCAETGLARLEPLADRAAQSIVALRLRGSLSLAERYRLTAALDLWRNRLHHIEIDDRGLVEMPTDDDFDALDTAGFVRLALERLKTRAADPTDAAAEAARMALTMVYLDHQALIDKAGRP